jgi:hypothetical protein
MPSALPGGPPTGPGPGTAPAAAGPPPLVIGVPAKPARNPTAFAGAHLGVPASPLEAFVSTDVRDYMWPALTPHGEREKESTERNASSLAPIFDGAPGLRESGRQAPSRVPAAG